MSLHHGSDPGISFFTFILSFLQFLVYLIGGIIMWWRRDMFPLNGRNASLDVATNFFACVSRIITCLRLLIPDGRPCWLFVANTLFPELAYTLCLTLRAWTLLFKSELALTIKKDVRSNSWYLRNRYLIGNRFIFTFLFLYVAIVDVIAILFISSDNAETEGRDPCVVDFNSPTILWESLVYILTWVLIVIIAYRVRHAEEDSYHIKKELRWTGIITAILFIIFQGGGAFVSKTDNDRYMLADFFDALIFMPVVIANVIVPVYLSFAYGSKKEAYLNRKRNRATISTSASKRPPLHALLHIQEGYDQFLQFLAKEWSTENLLFYKAVEEYRQVDEKERAAMMQEIRDKYLITNAPYDINIPGAVRTELLTLIDQAKTSSEPPSAQIFDVAYEEIYRLMSSDSYYRFANLVENGDILFDFSIVKPTAVEEKESSSTDRQTSSIQTRPEKNPLLNRGSNSISSPSGDSPRKLSFAEQEVQLDLSPLVEVPEKSEKSENGRKYEEVESPEKLEKEKLEKEKLEKEKLGSPDSPDSPETSELHPGQGTIITDNEDIEVEMTVL